MATTESSSAKSTKKKGGKSKSGPLMKSTIPAEATPSSPTTSASPLAGGKRRTIAYIQSLSPEKRNKKDTLFYSSLVLQTADGNKDALCFSKAKRNMLLERFEKQTAVEIYNHTTSDGKIFINEMTQISNARQGDYFFQYEENADEHALKSLEEIMKEANSMDMVNFCAKVVFKGDTETVSERKLKLAHCMVADRSSVMKLTLWQEQIDLVSVGCVYTFKQIRVREKDEGKILNSNKETIISATNDKQLEKIEVSQEQISRDNGKKSVSVATIRSIEECLFYKQCANTKCNKKIIQESSAFMVKCDHCKHRFRSSECKQNVMVHFIVSDPSDKSLIWLTAFNASLIALIGCIEGSDDQICEKLLKLQNLVITYNRW